MNLYLVLKLVKNSLNSRYKGSIMGFGWAFLTPVITIVAYTFVFGYVLKAKWGGDNSGGFPLFLYAGLMVFNIFAEVITVAPTLISSNLNYVKKISFPLELLCLASVLSSLIHFSINFLIFILALYFSGLPFRFNAFLLPILILPYIVLLYGLSLFFASIGTYIRDIGQLMSSLVTLLLFLSPVFYPATVLSSNYRFLFFLNPTTFIIEQVRDITLNSNSVAWVNYFEYSFVCLLVLFLGVKIFKKLRLGFADVL
jgi:lipopolysaccharide transport system permease protein